MAHSSNDLDYQKLREELDTETIIIFSFDKSLNGMDFVGKLRGKYKTKPIYVLDGWDLLSDDKPMKQLTMDNCTIYIEAHGNPLKSTDMIAGRSTRLDKFNYNNYPNLIFTNTEPANILANTIILAKIHNKLIAYWKQDNRDESKEIDISELINEKEIKNINEIIKKLPPVGHSSQEQNLIDNVLSTFVLPGQKIKYDKLAEKLSTFIGDRKKIIINLLVCAAARVEDNHPHANCQNSFAVKLYQTLKDNYKKNIPVIARAHDFMIRSSDGGKEMISLDMPYSKCSKDSSKNKNVHQEHGAKIVITSSKQGKTIRLDSADVKFARDAIKILQKVSCNLKDNDETKPILNAFIQVLKTSSNKEIYDIIATELDNPNSMILPKPKTVFLAFSTLFEFDNAYLNIKKLKENYDKKSAESKYGFKGNVMGF